MKFNINFDTERLGNFGKFHNISVQTQFIDLLTLVFSVNNLTSCFKVRFNFFSFVITTWRNPASNYLAKQLERPF